MPAAEPIDALTLLVRGPVPVQNKFATDKQRRWYFANRGKIEAKKKGGRGPIGAAPPNAPSSKSDFLVGESDPDVSAILKKGQEGKFLEALTPEEAKALYEYKGDDPYAPGAAIALNGMLREKQQLSGEQQAALEQIDSAFRKAPRLQKDTVLYRGVSDEIRPDKWGHIDSSAFVSTSTDPEVAEMFSTITGGGSTGEGLLYEIRVPKGFKVMPTSHFHSDSSIAEEHEVLLPRNVAMKVTGRRGRVVQVEVVGGEAWMMKTMPGMTVNKFVSDRQRKWYFANRSTIQARKQARGKGAAKEVLHDSAPPQVRAWAKERFKNPAHAEAFVRWFGDSKAVDAQGNPLTVYHGTKSEFSEFRSSQEGGAIFFTASANTASAYSVRYGPSRVSDEYDALRARLKAEGVSEWKLPTHPEWRALDERARIEGANVIPVHLSIKNPLELSGEYDSDRVNAIKDNPAEIAKLKQQGYDGIVVRRALDRPNVAYTAEDAQLAAERVDMWVAFEPTQVKSATGNRGTFDPTSADVRNAAVQNAFASSKQRRWYFANRGNLKTGPARPKHSGGAAGAVAPPQLDFSGDIDAQLRALGVDPNSSEAARLLDQAGLGFSEAERALGDKFREATSWYDRPAADVSGPPLRPEFEVRGETPLGGNHINQAFRATDPAGNPVVYKPAAGEDPMMPAVFPPGTQYKREVAAAIIDRELGTHLAPPTTVANGSGGVGSAQRWERGDPPAKPEARARLERLTSAEDAARLVLLDLVTGNLDRHLNNFLVRDNGSLVAIDNGQTFPDHATFRQNGAMPSLRLKTSFPSKSPERLPAHLAEGLGRLRANRAEIDRRLADHLTPGELRSMWERVDLALAIKDDFRGAIQRNQEALGPLSLLNLGQMLGTAEPGDRT